MNVLRRLHKRTHSSQHGSPTSTKDRSNRSYTPSALTSSGSSGVSGTQHRLNVPSASRNNAVASGTIRKASRALRFHNFNEVMKEVQKSDPHTLHLVGFGVSYVPPTSQSMRHLMAFADQYNRKLGSAESEDMEEHTEDGGHDEEEERSGIAQVKCFLIDEDLQRSFCDERNLVVGTPFLQIYWLGHPVVFRFPNGKPSDLPHGGHNGVESVLDETHDTIKEDSDLYIGQMHPSVLEYLVKHTVQAIDYLDNAHDMGTPVTVDVYMSEMNPTLWSRMDMTELDEDISTEMMMMHDRSSSTTSFDNRAEEASSSVHQHHHEIQKESSIRSMNNYPSTSSDGHHTETDLTDDYSSTMDDYDDDDYDDDDDDDYRSSSH